MPMCKALGCKNTSGRCDKSFFSIPNPTKSLDNERLCKQWLKNIRNPSLTFNTFCAHPSLSVCEDHFEEDDLCGMYSGHVAHSLNFHRKRKRLRPGAVPRLKDKDKNRTNSGRLSAETISKKRFKWELKKELDEIRHVRRNSQLCLDHPLVYIENEHGVISKNNTVDSVVYIENEPGCPDEQNEHGVISKNSTVDSVIYIENEHGVISKNSTVDSVVYMENEPGCPDEQNEHGVISKNSTEDSVVYMENEPGCPDEQNEHGVISKNSTEDSAEPMDVHDMRYNRASPFSSCAHPCLLCHRQIKDHSYARRVTYRNTETQTDTHKTESIENKCVPFHASTPCRKLMKSSEASSNSLASMTKTDDSRDITITSDLINSESEEELLVENNSNIAGEKKYLVFDTCLDELVPLISCPIVNCRSPVRVDDVKKEMKEVFSK